MYDDRWVYVAVIQPVYSIESVHDKLSQLEIRIFIFYYWPSVLFIFQTCLKSERWYVSPYLKFATATLFNGHVFAPALECDDFQMKMGVPYCKATICNAMDEPSMGNVEIVLLYFISGSFIQIYHKFDEIFSH